LVILKVVFVVIIGAVVVCVIRAVALAVLQCCEQHRGDDNSMSSGYSIGQGTVTAIANQKIMAKTNQ